MPIYLPSGGSITAAAIESALGYEPATAAQGALADTALQSLTQAAIIAALSTDPVFEGMAQFTSLGTPGDYTLAKSGIVVKNAAGEEVFRIWGTDPSDENYNSQNLYIGLLAGAAQPTDNVDAGYYNVGIGGNALGANTTGHGNVGIGSSALASSVTGQSNVAIGEGALGLYAPVGGGGSNTAIGGFVMQALETGDENVAVGRNAGSYFGQAFSAPNELTEATQSVFIGYLTRPAADAESNQIVIGANAAGAGSNTAVLGNSSITDAYFGSQSAAANTHQKRVFIVGTTAPADGDLAANQCALWFDPTDGAAKLMVKAKQADGSVKTGVAADVTT